MRPFNAMDQNVAELPRGITAGALLSEALWTSARVRQMEFAVTTRPDGSIILSREMAMALERELDGLRFALGMSIGVMAGFKDYGTGWRYERDLCVALGYGRLVLAQSAGYDFRYNARQYFPRDLQPRKRMRVAKKPPAPKALAIPAPDAART